jgi:hypothetical protein
MIIWSFLVSLHDKLNLLKSLCMWDVCTRSQLFIGHQHLPRNQVFTNIFLPLHCQSGFKSFQGIRCMCCRVGDNVRKLSLCWLRQFNEAMSPTSVSQILLKLIASHLATSVPPIAIVDVYNFNCPVKKRTVCPEIVNELQSITVDCAFCCRSVKQSAQSCLVLSKIGLILSNASFSSRGSDRWISTTSWFKALNCSSRNEKS